MYSIFSPQTTQNTCGWEIHIFVQRRRLRAHLHLAPLQIVSDTPTAKATSRRFTFPSSGLRRSSTTHQHTTLHFRCTIIVSEHSHSRGTTRSTQYDTRSLHSWGTQPYHIPLLPHTSTSLFDVQWRMLATNVRDNNGYQLCCRLCSMLIFYVL